MRLRPLPLMFAALFLPLSAPAAEPAPKKGNILKLGAGKATGKLLTRDQLRQCLRQQEALKSQGSEAAQAQSALDADKVAVNRMTQELEQQDAQLQTERAGIDLKNEAAVAAFNVKLKQREEQQQLREKAVAEYNAKLPPFNAQAQAYTSANEAWLQECGNREYDELDFYAIQRGK